jgi:hypothetical protein
MKKVAALSALGPIVGLLLFTWMGPRFLLWWAKPPVNPGVDCSLNIRWGMESLIKTQMVGVGVGLLAGLYLAFLLTRHQKREP